MDKHRLLVIGAGVNGSAVAAGLFNGGADVSLLARGRRFEQVSREGVIIENPFTHRRRVTRLPVINCLDPEDFYDFILVVVRKNQTFGLLPVLEKNRSPSIVFMGNNLSGPDEFAKVLGTRVMMGAVYAAGKRDGGIIRAMVFRSVAAPFGEVDGSITQRLDTLLCILRNAGFKAEASRQIVDIQRTHAVGVALISRLACRHDCDTRAMSRAVDELRLYVAARREGLQALESLGYAVLPLSEKRLANLPIFLQVIGMRLLLSSKFGEVGLGWHCSQAPDEMEQLSRELKDVVDRSGIRAPSVHKLLALGGL